MIMSEKILEVKHLGKAFGSNQVLRDIDFSVSPGDVTCIIGPSGSGKSTLLRCLNMLETPSTGEINYHGTDITSKNVNVPEYLSLIHISEPTRRRGISYAVFCLKKKNQT